MFIVWLVTLITLTSAAAIIGVVLRHARGVQAPPRSHRRDPQLHSPMSTLSA